MTIAAGFRFHQGILLCADTQITTPGYMKQSASKIVPIDFVSNGSSKVLFALAGDVGFSHMAIEHCRRTLAAQSPDRMTTADMMQTIEDTLQGFFEDHLFRHPHFERGHISVQMLIAIWSHVDQNLSLLAARENAVSIVRDYDCLGAGQFLTNYLVPLIFRHSNMPLSDIVHIALHVLRETKNFVDSCGGGTEIIVLRKDGTFGMPERVDYALGEQITQALRDSMRRLYVVCSDLNTSEEQLKIEFDTARDIIRGARRMVIEEHREREEHMSDSLNLINQHILDAKVIKS